MEYLRLNSIAWKTRTLTCQKYFRFGNDDVMCCTSATVIPVNFADRTGQMYVHVLPGNTPFLFPRPLMEKFGLVVDYGRKRLQWGDWKWTPVRQKNNTGHYLLNLAEDLNTLRTNLR